MPLNILTTLIISFFFSSPSLHAKNVSANTISGNTLIYPANAHVVKSQLPYLRWKVSKEDYHGQIHIQLSADPEFPIKEESDNKLSNKGLNKSLIVNEKIPAFLHWYPLKTLLQKEKTYYWRIRSISSKGDVGQWSSPFSFTIAGSKPFIVPESVTWDEFKAILKTSATYGRENKEGKFAEVILPKDGHLQLTQNPIDEKKNNDYHDYLINLDNAHNLTLNGNGCKITLTATHKKICGFVLMTSCSNLLYHNLTMDYDQDSQTQFGGKIIELDKENARIVLEIDKKNFPKIPDLIKGQHHLFFLNKEYGQKIGYKGTHWKTDRTWAEAKREDGRFEFKITSGWSLVSPELEIGDHALSIERGGDIFSCYSDNSDIALYNSSSLSSRSRWFIVRGKNKNDKGFAEYIRSINNKFLRKKGRYYGAPSGGINDWGDHTWHEGNLYEYSRDDMCHISHKQNIENVVKDNVLIGPTRNTIWVHGIRQWIHGNTLKYSSSSAIHIGGSGIKHKDNAISRNILVESNVIIEPNRRGIHVEYYENKLPDPVTGDHTQDIRLLNNSIMNVKSMSAIELFRVKDAIIEGNIIKSQLRDWWVWQDRFDDSSKSGIWIGKSKNVLLKNNLVLDARIAEGQHIYFADEESRAETRLVEPERRQKTGNKEKPGKKSKKKNKIRMEY